MVKKRIALALVLLTTLAVPALAAQTFEGELEVRISDDFAGNHSKTEYFLIDDSKDAKYRIRIKGAAPHELRSGMRVRLNGDVQDEVIVIDASSKNMAAIEILSGEEKALQDRSLAVIVVNFQNAAVSCSVQDIARRVFPDPSVGNTNDCISSYYLEASFGQVTFRSDTDGDGYPDVFGPYTINALSTDACDANGWGYEADQLAAADGVNIGLYKHVLYVIPGSNTCGWAGLGDVGCGTQCRAWIASCSMTDAFAHELGHNLGMRHAATDTNNDGLIDSEYGDLSDIMGYCNVGWRHQNAAHKDQMGWFGAFPGHVLTVTSGGTYQLAPVSQHPATTNLPQVLKIYKASTNEYYYVSYRDLAGYDATLRSTYVDKLSIHRFSASIGGKTSYVACLGDGQSFQDSSIGLTVNQVGHVTDPAISYSQVQISFVAVPQAPQLTVTPSQQSTSIAGSPQSYTLTATNMDSGSGGSTTFLLTATVPTGWTGSVSPSSLTLAPGTAGNCTLTVTPPATLGNGSYAVGAACSASGHPTKTAQMSYVLDTLAPDVPSGLSATLGRKNVVQLAWNASTDQGVGQISYAVYRSSGAAYSLIGATTTTSYKDSNTSVTVQTQFSYYVVAKDGLGNTSAPSSTASVLVTPQQTGKPPR